MSRLGKKPVAIPQGVKTEFKGNQLRVAGPLGTTSLVIPSKIKLQVAANTLSVEMVEMSREAHMMQGALRGIIQNMMLGVVSGFSKELEMNGLGYKALVEGSKLTLNVGLSHQIFFPIPQGIKIVVEKATKLTVSGIDKALVGEVAAQIRSYRVPEPYLGTGIKYANEHIIRKAGKAAAATGK